MGQFNTFSEWSNFISTHFYKSIAQAGSKVAEAFKRDVGPNVPFLHGDLSGGVDVQVSGGGTQVTITFMWLDEYAQRQYWEHSTKAQWDIKTWEQNKATYSQILIDIIKANLGG